MKVEPENPPIPLQCITLQINTSTGAVQMHCTAQEQHIAVEEDNFSQELRKWNENCGLKPKSEVERENPVIPHRIPPTFPPPPNSVTNTHQHCTPPPSSHLQFKSVVLHCSGADSSRHSWLVSAQHRCALIHCSALSDRCRASYLFPSNIECLKQRAVMKSVQILHCRMYAQYALWSWAASLCKMQYPQVCRIWCTLRMAGCAVHPAKWCSCRQRQVDARVMHHRASQS